MNIQLTTAQRLQQEKINGFITDLERQINQGNGAAVSADLGAALNETLRAFDRNIDSRFNATELTSLSNHLRQINTDQNIAQLFTTDGNLNRNTTSRADISGNGDSDNNGNPFDQNDFAALQQILASRSSTNTSQTVNPASSNTVSAGVGNPRNGINHFNGRGSFFVTESGFTILTDTNVGGHQTDIYDNTGKMITRIWGDPHVGDGTTAASGWNWHFGNDSTFILPDGTEIMFNTEGNASNNVYVTTGLYIKSGNDVYQTGQDFGTKTTGVASDGTRNSSITKLAMSATEFDARYADAGAAANGAGVFAWTKSANKGAGGWAILTDGGIFQDVKNEAWGDYLKADGASFKGQYEGVVQVSKAQMIGALDGDAVRSFNIIKQNIQDVPGSNPPIKADDLFLDYYFKAGANTKELKAFSNMILNGSSAEKLNVLNDYIRNGAEIPLTDDQESKFLNYLITPATSGTAKAYLALIKNNASSEKFELLDKVAKGEFNLNASQQDIFYNFLTKSDDTRLARTYAEMIQKGAGQDSIKYLEDYAKGNYKLDKTQENKFLDYLANEANTDIVKTYVSLVTGNDPNKAVKLSMLESLAANNATDKLDDTQEDTFLNYLTAEGNVNIAQTYASILNGNEADDIKTAKVAALAAFANNNGALSSAQENKFLDYLKSSTTGVANTYLALIKDNTSTEKLALLETLYSTFINAFPAGQTPTEAQCRAAAELITTNSSFGNNRAFLTNYAKFVSSGDTTSANNLIEIANYFGSKSDYASSIRSFRDVNLDAKTINTAKEVISFTKMLDTQNSPDLAGVLLVANRNFLIDTVLNKKDNIFNPATENDVTTSFFQSLKETFSKKTDAVDNLTYSDFARNAIYKFSNDLKSNGIVNRNSFTTVLVNDIGRGSLGIFANNGVAQMQIDVFEGMLSFYQSQIQQENAKPEPNTSKIGQWQNQINSHQTAITALKSTLS